MGKHNIILIGFMGTGKTTVAAELAKSLNLTRIDLDQEIVNDQNKSIPNLFAKYGEDHFRNVEEALLHRVLMKDRQVVATGGGAVLREANCICMKQNGFVVALTASPEVIIQRVSQDTDRPLLKGNVAERVHSILKEREDTYQFADLTLDTSSGLLTETIDTIIKQWRAWITR
ncbi:shikimate kinase [Paenibacillus larvae]